ncbi:Fructosamine kinase [Vibrio aerogenes CECT 7868]|uniref:Fructosamine kinase n=1 Tax=Vibrio aerogenes CECT 7868 TaxID=1216006 RepID=A0A1M5Z735_9VIBR|nr:fructosamine kinase family protein [Vibrio aerogenes]SHI20040.1 Fructosamine kinase [Vibrio aerogenes CECT 7868]
MWQGILQQLSETLRREFNLIDKQKIRQEGNNSYYLIRNQTEKFFVKISDDVQESLPRFICESDNLIALSHCNHVSMPKPVLVGKAKSHAFLILEYLQIKPLEDSRHSFLFGEQLARLHQWGEQKEFGFDQDNYIGMQIQPNPWNKHWHTFFAEQRIGWQLQLLHEKGIVFVDIDKFVARVSSLLAHHHPQPSLLHGDLWHGNVADTGSSPCCYDPACYWGDRECDIAMTELFGGFEPEFYQGYESILPLDFAYEERKHLYNLYHILNHCNCFGGHYLTDAQKLVDRISSQA